MRSSRQAKATVPRRPLWHPDVRARLQALFPELVVTTLAASCLAVVALSGDSMPLSSVIVLAGITQAFVQPILYACTYLGNDGRLTLNGWLFVMIGMPAVTAIATAFAHPPAPYTEPLAYFAWTSMGLGATIFYLTRLRGTFILLILEMLVLSPLVDELGNVLAAHLVGACALMVLFIMRCSATRVTMHMTLEDPMDTADVDERGSLRPSLYATVAGFGVIVSTLCLTASLAGSVPLLLRQYVTGTPVATTTHDTGQGGQAGEPSAGAGSVSGEAMSGTPSSEAQSDSAQGTSTTSDRTTDTGILGPLVGVLVLAALVLIGPIRLLMRRLARRSIEREPRAADRAAKIYLGIIARLATVDITRDEAETPSEFLAHHRKELGEVAEATGFDPSDWRVLTDAYEKARYADLDPSDAELETCWRIYDALLSYARQTQGLFTYLISSFWQM